MFSKVLSLLLAGILPNIVVCVKPVYAGLKVEKQAQFAQKAKAAIFELGVGRDAQVSVKLRDKTKLVGYISEAGENSFGVTDSKTGTVTHVAYPDVVQVNGQNISRGAKIAIGVAVIAAILILAIVFTPRT